MKQKLFSTGLFKDFQKQRAEHWNTVARQAGRPMDSGKYYRKRLIDIFRSIIPPGRKVLELGCGEGDLLSALEPSLGVGIDFSSEMASNARKKHSHLRIICADAHNFALNEKFDYIVLSDLVNDLFDLQIVLTNLCRVSTARTRIVLNFYSRLWQPPLDLARRTGLAKPLLPQNWFTRADLRSLLRLSNYEIVYVSGEILLPVGIPFVSWFANRFLSKFWPFTTFNLTNIMVVRPLLPRIEAGSNPKVTVLVPARNEEGNIPDIFDRIPNMAGGTEVIFVEGGSADNTYEAIKKEIKNHPEMDCKLFKQKGKGKGDAVKLGFFRASGDILIILDADLTVLPEMLPRFVDTLISGKAEFVNGVRLVYPMGREAMRFFNVLGNKAFSLGFTWILGQPIKDTLCGTKALWKVDYERIAAQRDFFGDFDPFGDFDLIFGASKQNLQIVDLPVRYQQRTYGDTNIQRWSQGWLLLKMFVFGAFHLKFI